MIQLFSMLIFLLLIVRVEARDLKINVISSQNGKGLEMDQRILSSALKELGCRVYSANHTDLDWNCHHADVNIFFERINPNWIQVARLNWLVPNPEWYEQSMSLLEEIDLILCRTKEVEGIFCNLGMKVYYLGFTSVDCYDPNIPKDYSSFFHLAGGNLQKGTKAIVDVWKSNLCFPDLILIQHEHTGPSLPHLHWISKRIETQRLRELQNQCGIHLCPSETEGFGHYLMEAMSAEAVVVSTEAPPMNEFVCDFLVPYHRSAIQNLAVAYYVDPKSLEMTILDVINTPRDELVAIGKKNRMIYLQKTQEFKTNLQLLINLLKEEKNRKGHLR